MSRLIFDIETLGVEFDSLDEHVKKYLLRRAKTDEEIAGLKESLSFYPVTGQIIAIGILDPDTERGAVYYQWPTAEPPLPFEEEGIRFETGTEGEILRKFWSIIKPCKQFITFNGRGFDCPFIIIRSAIRKIKPTRNLMPNRFDSVHIDLLDQLTFFGSTRRFSLDMYARAFGIKSPKSEMEGHEVGNIFRAGRYTDIARYCIGDLRATKELFSCWEGYIKG